MPLLLLGLGSPFGDDRLGWEVVDRLAAVPELPSDLIMRKARRGGLELLDCLDRLPPGGTWNILVVDALDTGGEPGTVHGPLPLAAGKGDPVVSTHAPDIWLMPGLLAALELPLERVCLYGMELDTATLAGGHDPNRLSDAVSAAVPRLVERITGDLAQAV